MRIRFLVNKVVDDKRKGTADEERYQAGQVYDLPDKAAQHWLNRQVAEVVTDDEPARDAPAATDDAAESDDDVLLSILDGTVTEIKDGGLDGLTEAQLDRVRELEKAGKNRNGVYAAIEDHIAALHQDDAEETDAE